MNNKDLYDLVKQKSSIVKTVSSFIDVQKKGNSIVAVCPFHNDTHPSMSVNATLNIFKCFVCGAGGNPIGFVQKYIGLSRSISLEEAIKRTAEINGIILPKNSLTSLVEVERKSLPPESKALDDLASFYRMELRTQAGSKAFEYLKNRKMDDNVLEHFGIGYAPKDNTLAIRTLREKKGYSIDVLEKAGILSSNSETLKDRYSERIMFPLKDSDGHAVGFSGRKYLPDDPSTSKYINSPETDLFKKSTLLYNLDNAIQTAKRDGYIYVTEGFMDVIALYRAGINSAVALMGTNVSATHLQILKKLNVEVRLSLDSDGPGQNATKKWLTAFTSSGIKFKITRPFNLEKDGKDADEVLDKYGSEIMVSKMNDLLDPITYAVLCLDKNKGDYIKNLDTVVSRLSSNYSYLSITEKGLLEQFLSSCTGLSASSFHERLVKDNKLPFEEVAETNDLSSPILYTSDSDKFNGQINLKLLGIKKQREFGGTLSDKTMYTEAQILARLPLSYDAAKQLEGSNFWFYNKVYRLISNYILSQYHYRVDTSNLGLDGAELDKAKTDLEFHLDQLNEEGVQSILTKDEVEKAFDFLNLMTSDDYRNDSFKELLENHRNYVDDENMSKKIGNDLDALADYKRKKLVISGVKKKSNSK